MVKIRLRTGANVTWWKGIKIRDAANRTNFSYGFPLGSEQFLEIQDSPNGVTRTATFAPGNLSSDGNVRIDFWMAKAFGVHTFMVQHTFDLKAMDGKIVTFTWKE